MLLLLMLLLLLRLCLPANGDRTQKRQNHGEQIEGDSASRTDKLFHKL
jgi:hypothetical protein